MKKRLLIGAVGAVIFLGIQFPKVAEAQKKRFDVLIKNAWVFDGSGSDSVRLDVGLKGERIVWVGQPNAKFTAKREIDATGLFLAPGFIDPHTHYLPQLNSEDAQVRAVHRALAQGVTTVFEGNDGGSPLPTGATLKKWDKSGIGPNAALFIGHNTVRRKVLGSGDVQPDQQQLNEMKQLVAQAMKDGAFGLSTGLFYNPGHYSKTEEVIELAKVAAQYGGIYDTHQRDEGSQNIGVINSSKEVIEIAEKANIPVHYSHIKVAGPKVWGKSREIVKLVEEAQAKGLNVTANLYPYVASKTGLHSALVPSWALDGGVSAMRRRFRQTELRDSIIKGIHASIQARTADPSRLVLASSDKELHGKSLADLAKQWNITPEEVVIKVCLTAAPAVHSFMMQEDDIEYFMKQPWVMTGSDGGSEHPRAFGTFARVIEEYVLKRGVIPMKEAIYKGTHLTAKTLQVKERGLIKEGYYADIVLFDPSEIRANATYLDGELLATGVPYVFVNGKLAIDEGKLQNLLNGKALRLNKQGSKK